MSIQLTFYDFNTIFRHEGIMELSTIIGIVVAVALIFYAIMEDMGRFFHLNSLFIVLGGTIGATLIRFPISKFLEFAPIMSKTFTSKIESPEEIIEKIISLSVEAKKNGILGLEKVKIENIFLKKGVQLAIDGVEPELIEAVLKIDMATTSKRHDTGISLFSAAGDAAPAFGMIGTLIGLVLMLANMDDPKSIGPAMSIALLTTLYGSFFANVLFLPIADKLNFFHQQEMLVKGLIVSGILSIANGDHPAVVQEKLTSYLRPASRAKLQESGKG